MSFPDFITGTAGWEKVTTSSKRHALGTKMVIRDRTFRYVEAAGTDVVGLIGSPWKDIVVAPTTTLGMTVGLTCNTITASYYGWVQTAGPALALVDAAAGTAVGSALMTGTNHAGQMELLTYEDEAYRALATLGSLAAVDNEYAFVQLCIE